MSTLVEVITSRNETVRNQPLEKLCGQASCDALLAECQELERFRHAGDNLYEGVRALFFLYAIHRFHLPAREQFPIAGRISFTGYEHLLRRRFEEAIQEFLALQEVDGPSSALSSALAAAYRGFGFQMLADQVRRSVRSVRGNQWMFRTGHPVDYPLRISPELMRQTAGLYPVLRETTPVRMDLTHSGWSDIFFLGMDFPEGARVLNVSIDLSVRGQGDTGAPRPPVEAYFRVIDEPVLRLVSIDLGAWAEIRSILEIFDFARDSLSLLKAAVIASGLVPPGMEGAGQPLAEVLERLTGKAGHGIEIVSHVNDIPKGSRLAVSTSLLACLIAVCMRATGQIHAIEGGLQENERRLVAARAILGEWLGGSGGGWQDSGGVWPGIKLIQGVAPEHGDPELGVSRGCLLPRHQIFGDTVISLETRRKLQDSLVLVHGGMAQDVGPILEMVTERYLLRSEAEWRGRQQAAAILDEVVDLLKKGNVAAIGGATERNFAGPLQTIIPWAGNFYTQSLIDSVRNEFGTDFWGFWMLGGMSGGGMGFIFDPRRKAEGQIHLEAIMRAAKRRLQGAVPFAMEPVVYDFAINEHGTRARLSAGEGALMPPGYYALTVPSSLRQEHRLLPRARLAELGCFAAACRAVPEFGGAVQSLFDRLLPQAGQNGGDRAQSLEALLERYGLDRAEHEQIQADLRAGRIGLAQNRLAVNTQIEDVAPGDVFDATRGLPEHYRREGIEALTAGAVAVVSLSGGVGSRWTKGAGVVKALNPFCRFAGRHRTFLEVHLAKSRRVGRLCGTWLPHVVTTSYLTHDAVTDHLAIEGNYRYPGPLLLSPGTSIGLRLVPMARDLRFTWEEMPQQLLDEQAQKVRDSLRATLLAWAKQMGEGSNYTDNLPMQCLHPVGHWYEVPNLLRNGVLLQLLEERPTLQHLMVHNIDTLGADVDPALLGWHVQSGAALTTEVIHRYIDDRGGGLARLDGRLRLVEGLALPCEQVEFGLTYYNSSTTWVHIDRFLGLFGLSRNDLNHSAKVMAAVRSVAARMPTYITLKDVKKRWGKGQEDIFPVAQFEKLWGDTTALAELDCRYIAVPRARGQQLKEVAQLDGWLRDGSAEYVESLCDWK